jgi:hypothetical protein
MLDTSCLSVVNGGLALDPGVVNLAHQMNLTFALAIGIEYVSDRQV